MPRPLNEVRMSLELVGGTTQIDVERIVCDMLNTDKWKGHIASINYLYANELGKYKGEGPPLATFVEVLISPR